MSTYAALSRTVVRNIQSIWILDSAAEDRNHPHIRLLPHSSYQKESRHVEDVAAKGHSVQAQVARTRAQSSTCGSEEGRRALGIPLIVRLVMIRVEPPATVVAVDVEHVRIAVGLYEMSSGAPSIECLRTASYP